MNKKVIWITGASSGIGRAVAEKFANNNWTVAVSARRVELLNELSKKENIYSYPADVTKIDQLNTVFNNIIKDLGKIDLCVFSSGTYERKNEKGIDPEKIRDVINVNLLGVVNSVKIVENYFKEKKKWSYCYSFFTSWL